MFIGHYGAALALKPAAKNLNLLWLFLAAEWLDIVFAVLGLAGVEKVKIVPGFTASSPLDLYYYPFSHSLLAALLWSALAYLLVRALHVGGFDRNRAGLVMAAAVFSHWVLDFISHAPDLSLWGGSSKVGLGLWNSVVLSYVVECVIFFGGLALYLSTTRRGEFRRRWGMLIFAIVFWALFSLTAFSSAVPPGIAVFLSTGLLINVVAMLIAGWLDKGRVKHSH